MNERLDLPEADLTSLGRFAEEVGASLTRTPRQLPSAYFYDALGSALFEAICELPWYGITRAERRLIAAHAPEIFDRLTGLTTIVELGSGSGEKLSRLVSIGRATEPFELSLHLIDVSAAALSAAKRSLGELEAVTVVPHQSSYEHGLDAWAGVERDAGRALMVFLGSNIGNFDRREAGALLERMRGVLKPGDALLIGVDLVKPAPALELAYADPLGITAAFNKNLLVRINRELGGTFDLARYRHEARWNPRESRVEMHLVANATHRVRVEAANLDLCMRAGESIWTESSYKYQPEEIVALLATAGFRGVAQWMDEDERFALTLATAG
jgi:L-histidine Nalpha-methyltransferase